MALAMASAANAQVVINEIMQSNIDCIMDDLNDFPDSWVELYNAGTESVNLSEYKLGTKDKASKAYQLPSETLAVGAYKIVYCDKVEDGWHTSFRLESGKDCLLYLFHNGDIVDQLPEGMKKQPAPNVAYGRETDGSENWGYQLTPTPGAANTGEICSSKDILESPVFSVAGKVFKQGEKFSVAITLPEESPAGTEIRYTTDGSEPTMTSKLYTGEISIEKTTVLRAKPFCKGYLSPQSTAQSYISFDRDVTLPVVSIVTDKRYLTDNKIGILVDGTYSSGTPNYKYDWRRPMNFEVFDGNYEESCINQLGEARLAGNASREHPLKSFAIYANKRFGEKRFSHEFFPDQRPGLTEYKSLMLRNAGNDFDYLYMRDAVIQNHMRKYVDIDFQAYKPAIIYVNGEYKGMLNIRERSNEDNVYTNYDGLEDLTMVENWWELKEGTWDMWQEFVDYYTEEGHSYEEFDQVMDVQEFMNVVILNLFYCNLDFPGNNMVLWRPIADGGRWRVIVKDTDFGLGLYGRSADYKVFEWIFNPNYDQDNNWANREEHTRLFRRLMDDEKFYNEFIDRFAIYMGDFMNYERTWCDTWEAMTEAINYEYPHHRELYNAWWPNRDEELKSAKNWLKSRVGNMYKQLNDYFKVGKPVDMTVSAYDDDVQGISFNGVQLSQDAYKGKYFVGRDITLSAENANAWLILETIGGKREETIVDGSELDYTIPENCTKVVITAFSGEVVIEPEPEVVDDPLPAAPAGWTSLLANGNAAEEFDSSIAYDDAGENYKICAWSREDRCTPHPAEIEVVDGTHAFVVHSEVCRDPYAQESAWDNQFWIMAPRSFKTGDEIKVSFRYKASSSALVTTQVHTQTPSVYLHWEGVGDVNFDTEWKTFEKQLTVSKDQNNMWSFAFNLNAQVKDAVDFYIDDIQWLIKDGSGISDSQIEDADAKVEYFTIQGLPIDAANMRSGIYVRRQGSRMTKVYIK